jgi:DNA repair exonuclease SbcCD ATPase subunit
MPEKDSFGDKLRDKERGEEEQHFAKRDRELLEKLRGRTDPAAEMRAPEVAQGCCPKCGNRLEMRRVDDVVLEECASCRGIWLCRDEIAKLSRREVESFFGRFFRQILGPNPH